ncbi:MAG: hypothetical protein L0271_15710 [Gemmatimonadetes bacterium]|nr:hypothetical protein [Gemmatimonadota bacterium]
MTARSFATHFVIGLAFVSTGCDDGLGLGTWVALPDTSVIYSLSRPELLRQPAAYDFVQLRRITVENPGATGTWDAALAEEGGVFVLVPASNFPLLTGSTAAIGLTTHTTLETLTEAPGDTAAYSRQPVELREGAVYVVRTRRDVCIGFGTGVRYAKFKVIAIDAAMGAVTIAAIRNPFCNDRKLIPPDEN